MEIQDEIRKCVAFACYKDEMANIEPNRVGGTIFFLALGLDEMEKPRFYYAVTARHVVEGIGERCIDDKLSIRINTKDGGYAYVDTELSDWRFHPNESSVDAAVLHFGGYGSKYDTSKYDIQYIPTEMGVTKENIEEHRIGIGEEVFLTGLFVNHFGRHKNLPIIRTGNIALMPEEPIQNTEYGAMEAYLIEARSIGGLSGSPVFLHLWHRVSKQTISFGPRFFWLGLMHGHWDARTSDKEDLSVDAFTKERVNMGIAIVVPANKVLEILNQKYYQDIQNEFIKELVKERSKTPD